MAIKDAAQLTSENKGRNTPMDKDLRESLQEAADLLSGEYEFSCESRVHKLYGFDAIPAFNPSEHLEKVNCPIILKSNPYSKKDPAP